MRDLSPELSAHVQRVFNIKPKPRWVVRISTSAWLDDRGVHIRRDVNFLKRLSTGENPLREDCLMSGAEETLRGTNLDPCEDGLYEVVVKLDPMDPETGYAEGWKLRFVPYRGDDGA